MAQLSLDYLKRWFWNGLKKMASGSAHHGLVLHSLFCTLDVPSLWLSFQEDGVKGWWVGGVTKAELEPLSISEMLRSPAIWPWVSLAGNGTSPPGIVPVGLGGTVFFVCCQEESRNRGAWGSGSAVLWAGTWGVCLPGSFCRVTKDLWGTILQKFVLFFPVRNVSHCLLGNTRWMALMLIWGATSSDSFISVISSPLKNWLKRLQTHLAEWF